MTVRKRGSGYAVVHCHGKKKGQTIARHKTKAGAEAQHRAIHANKKHHSAEDGDFLARRQEKFGV